MPAHYHLINNEETGALLQIQHLSAALRHPWRSTLPTTLRVYQLKSPGLRRWLSLCSPCFLNTRIWDLDVVRRL